MPGEAASIIAAAIEDAALAWQPGPPKDDIAIVVIRVPTGPD